MKAFRIPLIASIILSIIFSFLFVYERIQVENNYKHYEMAIYYDTLSKLSGLSGTDFKEYLGHFIEGKIDHILIEEDTISGLKSNPKYGVESFLVGDDLHVKGSDHVLKSIGENLNKTLKNERKITFLAEDEIVIEGLPSDIQYADKTTYYSDKDILYGAQPYSLLEYVGLGFDENKIAQVKAAGGKINLSPTFQPKLQDANKAFDAFKGMMEKHGSQNFLLFLEKESYLSASNGLNEEEQAALSKEFRDFLVQKDIAIFLNENRNQRANAIKIGLESMVFDPEIGKIRGFITPDFIQNRYDYNIPSHHNGEEIVNTYYRAISERNIAVIVVTPFIKNKEVVSDDQDYVRIADGLEERLKQAQFYRGDVKAMQQWQGNRYRKIPIALGVIAAALLLLDILFGLSDKKQAILYVLGSFAIFVFYVLGIKTSLGDTLFNLVAITSYPLLALCYILYAYKSMERSDFKSWPMSYLKGVKIFIIALMIAMVGNLMQISLLSATNNMLELVIFRGVKLSQLLPIFMLIFVFAKYTDAFKGDLKEKYSLSKIKSILNGNIKVYHVLILVVGVMMMGILLLRSGNTSIKISPVELLFRNVMEQVFVARPRTKAIFIGYPSIILLIVLAYQYKHHLMMMIFGFFAMIGLTSLMNTFSHIRTHVMINVHRVLAEVLMVLVISVVYLVIATCLIKILERYRNRVLKR